MIKNRLRVAVLFSVIVFVSLTLTMFLTGSMAILLYQLGILNTHHRESSIIFLALVSIVVGTTLSYFVGKRPMRIIEQISEATKQVAGGNFDIQLDENIHAAEFQEMARNFNRMARELAHTEMLHKDFIENVSHEFKTPLTAIEGYVTLLQKKNLSEDKRREYTQKILFNTKRLNTLTGNILLLSKLENQQLDIQKENYSLDEQIREIILLLEEAWNKKGLELDIDLADCVFYGNKDLIAHVWQNILSNAIKFAPDSGLVRILLHKTDDNLKISISDNGIGMNKDIQQRVFEKFYQGDSSHSSQGNGLGLTLAKRIVDLHDGEISVSSKEGQGTSFTVTLPLDQETQKK